MQDFSMELSALDRLSTGDLAERYKQLHGQPCRTRQRDRPADASRQLLHQHAKPLAKAYVSITAPRKLMINPLSHDVGSFREECNAVRGIACFHSSAGRERCG